MEVLDDFGEEGDGSWTVGEGLERSGGVDACEGGGMREEGRHGGR